MSLKVKVSLLVICLLVVAAPLSVQATGVKINFWNGWTGPDYSTAVDLVNKFNTTHPNIDVEMQTLAWDQYYTKLDTTLAAGKGAPEIFVIHDNRLINYAVTGQTANVTELIREKLPFHDFVSAALSSTQYREEYYGIPVDSWTYALYYNKDMFKDAGLAAPPMTWQELRDFAQKLTKGETQWGIALSHTWMQTWLPLVFQKGGAILAPNGKEAAINSPEVVEALQFWVDLFNTYKVSPSGMDPASATMLFKMSQAAMMIVGPWEIPGCNEANVNFATAPLPRTEEQGGSIAESHILCIYSGIDSTKLPAAETFIKFMLEDTNNLKWVIEGGKVPVRKSLIESEEYASNEYLRAFGEMLPMSHYFPQSQIVGVIVDSITTALDEAVIGGIDPEEALNKAANRIDNELAIQ